LKRPQRVSGEIGGNAISRPGKPACSMRSISIRAKTAPLIPARKAILMFSPVVGSVLYVFNTVVDLYEFVIILAVVASWLIVFGVLSMRNQLARSLVNMLDALTDPVFRQVRRMIPSIGGIDLSPIIVFIILEVIRRLVNGYAIYLM
jgi:YggT family protein